MNLLWKFCIEFVILLPLTNTLSIIPTLNRNTIYSNSLCNQNFTIFNNPLIPRILGNTDTLQICHDIENAISYESQVFYLYDPRYYDDIHHYSISSTNFSVCSVEPGTTNDLAIIMKIIGKNRVPFGIKSGGHSLNPGFSSTKDVHISMLRFSQVNYNPTDETVDVGPGLVWNDVYKQLQPYNVSVLGGRVSNVGVGGFLLGGGYGWKSNQYGLSIDTILEYELVTPNGTIVNVNNETYPDLFFGLKGGLNNFGIVTNFKMRALPQTLVYGGVLLYDFLEINDIVNAAVNFQTNNQDPKAQILCDFTSLGGSVAISIIAFYDAPIAPPNTFDVFTSIRHLGKLQTRSFLSLVQASPVFVTDNMRGRFHTISVSNISKPVVEKVRDLFIEYTLASIPYGRTLVNFDVEPFLPSYFEKSQGGAYPHSPSNPLFPIVVQFGWQSELDDQVFINATQTVAEAILEAAIQDGQDLSGAKEILYPNYALIGTPLSKMYGNNVDRLKSIRQQWDPENIMYLTGGFKF
ncbi:unnamed protein product [Adineta steineri]|uniref:FAD-binding PCMH-type domain-containing protein n=1 Tax=Adineta steineri TaxID=433720 RepID=A0A819P5E4_9BILA|nr:unnamed protein product [Adineta steineri]CAF4004668.1 unnamed protein product [Adineta steineri]